MWEKLKAFWNLLRSKAAEWANLVLKFLRNEINVELLNIAKEVVKEVEQLALSGDILKDDKRKEALARLREYAVARGIKVKESTLSYALELALQYWEDIGWPF